IMKTITAVLVFLVTVLYVASSIPIPGGGSCSETFKAHPNKCNAFYYCINGKYVEKRCMDGLHWNSQINACDFPESGDCKAGGKISIVDGDGDISDSGDNSKSSGDSSTSEESVPGSGKCPESNKKPKCPASDPKYSVFFPHSNPHFYFHCSNGVAYCRPCPSPLVWNSECDTCDWKGQNNCPKRHQRGFFSRK
ncbi:hypothetical protein L9F63_004676, partial [Diploptera punctata]